MTFQQIISSYWVNFKDRSFLLSVFPMGFGDIAAVSQNKCQNHQKTSKYERNRSSLGLPLAFNAIAYDNGLLLHNGSHSLELYKTRMNDGNAIIQKDFIMKNWSLTPLSQTAGKKSTHQLFHILCILSQKSTEISNIFSRHTWATVKLQMG